MSETLAEIHTDVTWTPDAWEQFKAMKVRAGSIGAYYGELLGTLAEASLYRCITQVFASGPTRISKAFDFDGLLMVTPHITMGMVFHEMPVNKLARAIDHPEDEVTRNLNHPSELLRWPRAGEWSLHS